MEMRPGYPPAPAHGANPLSRLHHLPLSYISSAEVEVGRDQPTAVIQVDGPARQIEVSHQRHNPPARCKDRLSHGTGKVSPEVTALDFTVEHARGPKGTGYAAGARQPKRARPEPGPRLRATRDRATLQDFRLDSGRRGTVGFDEAGRHFQDFTGISTSAHRQICQRGVTPLGPLQEERDANGISGLDRHSNQGPKVILSCRLEVQRLSCRLSSIQGDTRGRCHPDPAQAALGEADLCVDAESRL